MSVRRFLFAAAVVAAMIPLAGPSVVLASSPSAAPSAVASAKASAKPGKPKMMAHKPKMVKSIHGCFKNCAGSANNNNGQAPSHI